MKETTGRGTGREEEERGGDESRRGGERSRDEVRGTAAGW